jgi:hypothetical protein
MPVIEAVAVVWVLRVPCGMCDASGRRGMAVYDREDSGYPRAETGLNIR